MENEKDKLRKQVYSPLQKNNRIPRDKPIEAEETKKRWQGSTEELYKKDNDPDKHDGVINHLEPDILECKVKWVLGSITTNKASRGDGIPVELFQILKNDVVKLPLNMHTNLENSAVATGLEKADFHSSPKKGNAKVPGASVRNSAHGKSHEEGGSAYAKAGSSLRIPPGNSRASTPKTRVCLLYCFVLSPTPLTLRGAVPHHHLSL